MSTFYGIGVGPGDPELLTLKAVSRLKSLDILLVPKGKKDGHSEALEIARPHLSLDTKIIERHFPMTSSITEMAIAIDPISAEIETLVKEGLKVGFITLGDPMLYSTYIYLLKRLKGKIAIETICGVSSFSSMASGFNRPLVEGDTPLLIYPCAGSLDELEKNLIGHDSLVLMKVYRSFEDVKKLINKHQLDKYSLVVSDFSKPNQKSFSNINDASFEDISYFTTILINKRWEL